MNIRKLILIPIGVVFSIFFLSFLTSKTEAAGTNLVPNPSVENVRKNNSSLPVSWNKEKDGNNNAQFTYLETGRTGSRSLKINISSYTSGDAHYYFNHKKLDAGKYDFSVYYKSNVKTEAYAEIYLTNGDVSYIYLGDGNGVVASKSWNRFSASFTVPSNALKVSVYLTLASKGYLITDDYSLVKDTGPIALNRPIVTLTFDDTHDTMYQYAYPLFVKYGLRGNIYITSSELDESGMMNKSELMDFYNLGFEMGSHTVTHPHLTTLNIKKVNQELRKSKNDISNYFGVPVVSFASPYGEYNLRVNNRIANFYQSHRTTEPGFNSLAGFNPYEIKAYSIESNMSADYVKGLIDQAIQSKTWLVLVYHDVRPDDGSGFLWTTTPENMESVLSYLSSKGVAVETTRQAVAEVSNQL